MNTEVIMKREIFESTISQQSISGFFSATDLVLAGNKWRLNNNLPLFNMSVWLQNQGTQDFIQALENKFGKVKISSRGKNCHTWVHPYLFIDMALAISPNLKIEVYSWIYDHLLQYRNDSGDSYKKMAGALYDKFPNKSKFPLYISEIADKIKIACNVQDWQKADEKQLKMRDKIHENISLLTDIIPCNDAVRISIDKVISELSTK